MGWSVNGMTKAHNGASGADMMMNKAEPQTPDAPQPTDGAQPRIKLGTTIGVFR